MLWLRRSLFVFAVLCLFGVVLGARYYCIGFLRRSGSPDRGVRKHQVGDQEEQRLKEKLSRLRPFATAHGYNTHIVFLADMLLGSGKNRFFVCDLERDSVMLEGLVAHGSGNRLFSVQPAFSNADGSGCSSLGRYKIGSPYPGRFGRAYKLYGLDSTNDHAFRRNIVLHSYECVPESETDPYPICNSLGCAMISPGFLKQLEPVIDGSKRPILLWVFD